MFSRTIFKQTLGQNWKLWAVFTGVTAALGAVIIAVYDQKMFQSMMDMMKQIPGLADMLGDRLGDTTTLLSMLGKSFYSMQGVILPMIYVLMTANSLVAAQVDRGSMAYILSAPITRARVVRTQALYLITGTLAMFLIVALAGMATVQFAHNGLWGKAYTADVKAVASQLGLDRDVLSDDLTLIARNPEAFKAGAKAREVDEEVYSAYLTIRLTEKSYAAAAKILELDASDVSENPTIIETSADALIAASKVMGMEPQAYSEMLAQAAARRAAAADPQTQSRLMAGITAAAELLDADPADLATDMGKIKASPSAFGAALEASGLSEDALLGVINGQLAADEISYDKGLSFSIADYIYLNLGVFLLMFAVSGISFLFSCVFNLTKHSLALGAGIPVACFIFQIMAQASAELEWFKYLSINTLFDPDAIAGGGSFTAQFLSLAALGTTLYAVGIKVFKEKDLPL